MKHLRKDYAMKKTLASMMVAGAMAASLVMFGCGGQPAAKETPAQEKTTQEQKTETKTEEKKTQEQAPAETKTDTTATTEATPAPAAQSTEATNQITLEEAKAIALKDAGVTEADVTGLDAKLETDDGVTKYDVDFKIGNMDHDYDIDPTTGAIINHTSEIDD